MVLDASATWNGNSYCSHEDDYVRKIGYGWHPLQIARLANRDADGNRIAPDYVFLCRGTNDATHTPFAKITDFGSGNDEIPETDIINGTDYGFKRGFGHNNLRDPENISRCEDKPLYIDSVPQARRQGLPYEQHLSHHAGV